MAEEQSVAMALEQALSSMSAVFAPNELAYLALTSKAELPVRDRLAWKLERALGDPYAVSREWRRADIAVLRGDAPVVQVEAKAMYAFDVLSAKDRAKFLAKLMADGLKMAELGPSSSAFLLALITHVEGSIEPHLRRYVVKYSSRIQSALAREGGDAVAVRGRARQTWEAELAQFEAPWRRFEIDGGDHWGLGVGVDAYLIGPLTAANERPTGDGARQEQDEKDRSLLR